MKILLTGVNGQVGFYLKQKLSPFYEVFGVTRENFDLTNIDQMRGVIDKFQPGLIINSAARSAIIIVGALVFPDVIVGITDASTIRRFLIP